MEMLKGAHFVVWVIARAFYIILPNLNNYDVSSVLALGAKISGAYIATTALYSLLYIIAALSIACAMFHSRELL